MHWYSVQLLFFCVVTLNQLKYVQGIGALKWKSIIPVNVTYIITVHILHGCGISYTFNFMYYSEFQDSSEREDDIFQCCGHSCFHHHIIISEDW